MKIIVIISLVITSVAAGIAPAAAADDIPAPTPQALPRCESTSGVLTQPMAYGVTTPLATSDASFRALPATGGAVITSSWQDLMTGFAFDGQVNGDTYPGGFIETHLAINYRFPASSCDRVVDWEADLILILPNGARTLGHPDNFSSFGVAAVADPLGELSIPTAVDDSTDFTFIVNVVQAHGTFSRTKPLSGSMVIPAGAPGNLFIVVMVQLFSRGGTYCLGLCGQAYSSYLDQEGVFDLAVPGGSGTRSGVAYVARRAG